MKEEKKDKQKVVAQLSVAEDDEDNDSANSTMIAKLREQIDGGMNGASNSKPNKRQDSDSLIQSSDKSDEAPQNVVQPAEQPQV